MRRWTARLRTGPAALAAVLIGVAPIAMMAPPVAAAPVLNYGPMGVGLRLRDAVITSGATLHLVVTGSRQAEHFVVTMVGETNAIGQADTNAQGNAAASVVIPRQTHAGEHTITLTGNKGNVVSAAIYVDATTAAAGARLGSPSSGGLTFTATDAIASGAGAVAIAGLVVLGTRRRRRSTWAD